MAVRLIDSDANELRYPAAGTTDKGGGAKIAVVYRTSTPTYSDGQRGDLLVDANGRLIVSASGTLLESEAKQTRGLLEDILIAVQTNNSLLLQIFGAGVSVNVDGQALYLAV